MLRQRLQRPNPVSSPLEANSLRTLTAAIRRYRNRSAPPPVRWPILVNSIPKSGTHLLKNVIGNVYGTSIYARRELGYVNEHDNPHTWLNIVKQNVTDLRGGILYTGHIPYTPQIERWLEKHHIKHIFIYRDPRDYVVSLVYYIMKKGYDTRHRPFYDLYANLPSHDARLMAAIVGHGAGQTHYTHGPDSINAVSIALSIFLNWLDSPHVLALRYEDFIASDGGPAAHLNNTLERIVEYLEIEPSETVFQQLREGMQPQRSVTFRKGGSHWRTEFTPEHIAAFKATCGDLLAQLGYNW